MLRRCRARVRPALADAVRRLDPYTGEMAAYAMGWRDTGGSPAPGASEGKGLRQALAVLGAEAAGADGSAAVPGAVAVELVHAFSLLHDDIMDGDAVRRQRETVWKAYGTGPAVLAGDALFALAVQVLAEVPGPHTGAAVRRLCDALAALVRGQSEDLCFERRPWTGPGAVRPGAYRSMAEHKTGALLGCAAALGAQLSGAPDGAVAALDRAGRHLGVAFQAVDDLLGVWGDPAVTGKPVHGDLRQRKKTFPVLAALAAGGARHGSSRRCWSHRTPGRPGRSRGPRRWWRRPAAVPRPWRRRGAAWTPPAAACGRRRSPRARCGTWRRCWPSSRTGRGEARRGRMTGRPAPDAMVPGGPDDGGRTRWWRTGSGSGQGRLGRGTRTRSWATVSSPVNPAARAWASKRDGSW